MEYLRALLDPNYAGHLQIINRGSGVPFGAPGQGLLESILQVRNPPRSWGGMQTPEERNAVRERASSMSNLLSSFFSRR